ncbi:MAG: universal stress protein [Flavobacteriales bacterium]|nr:universal stress protein [Flavobacteriales bacterium]
MTEKNKKVTCDENRIARLNVMKNILVPIDFSEHSKYALETAAMMEMMFDVKVHLLHVVDKLPDQNLSYRERVFHESEELPYISYFEDKIEELAAKTQLQKWSSKVEYQFNSVYQSIDFHAKSVKADLIIIGSKGKSGKYDPFIGANAERLLRYTEYPCLVVKNKPNIDAYMKVLVSFDFKSESFDRVGSLASVLQKFAHKFNFIRVVTPSKFELSRVAHRRMKNFSKFLGVSGAETWVETHYSVEDGILEKAKELGIKVLAISTYEKRRLTPLLQDVNIDMIFSVAVAPYSKLRDGKKSIKSELNNEIA